MYNLLKEKKENLVEKPEAHEKVWVSIEEWSKYGNLQYTEVWKKLRFTSVQVLKRMEQNDGLYIPADLVLGRHVFFAVDNVDFAEDTPDGKNTFHSTAMAI